MRDKTTTAESNTSSGEIPKKTIKFGGTAVGAIVFILIACAAVSIVNFYNYLGDQLFEERKAHLIEISEKVSEVVDTVIDSSWDKARSCSRIILRQEFQDETALLESLAEAADIIDGKETIVMAFDQDANFYTSDGNTGYWNDPSVFLPDKETEQEVLSSIPYQDDEATFMIFICRMSEPKILEESGKLISHVALAVNLDSLREVFTVSGFQDQCYTYIINQEGRRLYRHTFSRSFIDGYNILSSLEQYEFTRGGTIDDLKQYIAEGGSTALEFDYEGTGFFVASTDIRAEEWRVMLFVPTEVLGANTSDLMNRTIHSLLNIGLLAVTLISVTVYMVTASNSDKRLLRQQEQTNALLTKAAEEAQSANAAKSEFLSHMSHDIRTPINGVMGMTSIAMQNADDPERVLDCLKKIEGSSRHLLSLVNDVLDMSRIESGRVSISHELMDIRTVADHCTSIISSQLAGRNVEFISDFEDFRHPNLMGDELHLRQILLNILGNAAKFVKDGGKIIFRMKERAESDGKVIYHFEIEDTGIGMKPEFLPHIWDAFSQENGGNRTNYKGTGLGMAITKQFVDLMGGTIAVESEWNVGSRFTVELPFAIADELVKAEEEEYKKVVLSGMRILLVEDNELNMEIAQYILENSGIEVKTAENGQIAVELFQKNAPGTFDAILMDVTMPVMDGLTATRVIRGLERTDAADIPIIAMTANAYEEDIKKARDAGMNLHLSKPINADDLLKELGAFKK